MSSILSFAGSMVDTLLGNSIISPTKDLEPTDESIQVCVRIRPILTNEREDSYAWMWEENTIYPHIPTQMPYTFDHLFYPENSNDDIFNSVVKTIVLRSMKGYHGSVFTYGQTSSGKTFTMNGSQSQPGIIPQSIFYCFESIQEHFTDREFLFRVCYIEVYNEQVKDLLSTEPTQIKIQHDPKLGTILSGVKEQVVLNPQQVIALLKAGEAHRHVGTTDMNEKSSRAHTLFKLIIESKKRGDDADAPVRVSNLNLVDLAGSENAKMTNSVGERAREAKYINQSLLTLSLIIQRLSEEKPGAKGKQYLPYRDSKLTRLLQQSLSGNAQIAVICTVSPTLRCVDESHNTLKFAARAKKIKTSATINELIDDKTLLRAYKMEIHLLKVRLAAMEGQPRDNSLRPSDSNKNGSGDSRDAYSFSEEDQRDENDEDGEGVILQMISEMERLILKADLTAANTPNGRNKHFPSSPLPSPRGQKQPEITRPSLPSTGKKISIPVKIEKEIVVASRISTSVAQLVPMKTGGLLRKSGLKPPGSRLNAESIVPLLGINESRPNVDIIASGEGVNRIGSGGRSELKGAGMSDDSDEVRENEDNLRASINSDHSDHIPPKTIGDESSPENSVGRRSSTRSSTTDMKEFFNGNNNNSNYNETWKHIRTPANSVSALEDAVMGEVAEESDFLKVQELFLEDSQSSSGSFADRYLKAISPKPSISVSQRSSFSGKSDKGSNVNVAANKITGRASLGSNDISAAAAASKIATNRVSLGSSANRKFGFVSSPSLPKFSPAPAISKSSPFREPERIRNSENFSHSNPLLSPKAPSSSSSSNVVAANVIENGTVANRISAVTNLIINHGDSKEGDADEKRKGLTLTLTEMLAMLKKHVEKSSAARRRQDNKPKYKLPPAPNLVSSAVSSALTAAIQNNDIATADIAPLSLSEKEISFAYSMSVRSMSESPSLNKMSVHSSGSHLEEHTETLLNLQLVGADNRFLLEELEKKESMMAMLTEGLREVELNQLEKDEDTYMVSRELAQALEQNEELNEEIIQLKEALAVRERQLVFISGVLPNYEDF